jgi:hypothetical protein
MASESLGSCEFSEVFYFSVSNRADDGTATAFAPAYFDVINNEDGAIILADQVLTQPTDLAVWRGQVDTRDIATDQSGPFEPMRTYGIVVKEDTSDEPTTFQHYNFTVTGAYSVRLKRILGLEGENLLVDNFVYDNGNNATSFRVRVFDTPENASAATPGIVEASVPETGEIYTFDVTQTFQIGRQLRQSHLSVVRHHHEDL